MDRINSLFEEWKIKATDDSDLTDNLYKMEDDLKLREDAFYKNLEFGTGGLRGIIGAGTNRMNIYTVAKASHGLSCYLRKKTENPRVAISFDSRIKSELFAKTAAKVFAGNGIEVFFFQDLCLHPAFLLQQDI